MSFLPAITIPGVDPVMGDIPAVGEHTDAILAELGLLDSRRPREGGDPVRREISD